MLPRHAQRRHPCRIRRRPRYIRAAVNREKAKVWVKLGRDDAMVVKLSGKMIRNARSKGTVSNDRRR
jgi:hypothetical protein